MGFLHHAHMKTTPFLGSFGLGRYCEGQKTHFKALNQ